MTREAASNARKTAIQLTPGSRVRVHSAGSEDQPMVSTGLFRGLVSIGGDNSLAVELDGAGEEHGRVRLIPLSALMAVDIVEAAKPEEEKRAEPASPGYFR